MTLGFLLRSSDLDLRDEDASEARERRSISGEGSIVLISLEEVLASFEPDSADAVAEEGRSSMPN